MERASFDLREFATVAVAILIALTFHEFAHGYAAFRLGDDTAAKRGRLTLNPLKHIDLVGTLVLPVLMIVAQAPFVIGWAKAVPVRLGNLRNPKRDMSLVAAAGPLMNLALAVPFGALFYLTRHFEGPAWLTQALGICGATNLLLGAFNRCPCRLSTAARWLPASCPTAGQSAIWPWANSGRSACYSISRL